MVTLRDCIHQAAGTETSEMKFWHYCGERICKNLTEKQVMAKERKVKDQPENSHEEKARIPMETSRPRRGRVPGAKP